MVEGSSRPGGRRLNAEIAATAMPFATHDGAFTDHAGAVAWLAEIAADGRLERYLAEGR